MLNAGDIRRGPVGFVARTRFAYAGRNEGDDGMKRAIVLCLLALAGCSESICHSKGYTEGSDAWAGCVDHYDTLIGNALAGMGEAGARH